MNNTTSQKTEQLQQKVQVKIKGEFKNGVIVEKRFEHFKVKFDDNNILTNWFDNKQLKRIW